jgi:hypothetical protein
VIGPPSLLFFQNVADWNHYLFEYPIYLLLTILEWLSSMALTKIIQVSLYSEHLYINTQVVKSRVDSHTNFESTQLLECFIRVQYSAGNIHEHGNITSQFNCHFMAHESFSHGTQYAIKDYCHRTSQIKKDCHILCHSKQWCIIIQ